MIVFKDNQLGVRSTNPRGRKSAHRVAEHNRLPQAVFKSTGQLQTVAPPLPRISFRSYGCVARLGDSIRFLLPRGNQTL